jgi:hypothetical protein
MTPTPPLSPSPVSDRISAIENEIPEYRAISPLAICSILFGMVSALSFIDPWFLIAGVIAVGFGFLAIRNINRFPTVLTGKSIAQAGIGLALAFSLSAGTITLLNGFILNQRAAAFGKSFAKIIASNDLADAMWYRTPPSGRRGLTPRKLLAELEKASPDAIALEDRVGPVRNLLQRAARPGAKLTFEGVEKSGHDRLMTFAVLVYKIQGGTLDKKVNPDRPVTPDEKALDQEIVHAAIEIRSEAGDPPFSWYIYNVILPYKKHTHVLAVQPVDDGHGHSH